MRFAPEFIEEIKGRLRPSDVIGRTVKLKKRGDTYWGLSPFKTEKTPSFTVSDRRGTYHCFATAKHGTIFNFLMETERLTFPEAVERLAREAGLALPAADPQEAERSRARKGLLEACEAAADFFSKTLKRAEGRPGAAYLDGRAVGAEAIAEFRLGYAPDSRAALKDHLINKGYTEDILLEAGLIGKPDDGGASYDRFRQRVMFPIANAKGEVIAFGGRALDPDARAKYLNSPETPIFRKGEVLYNLGPARTAAGDEKQPFIVCEGYMDVIALSGAGFRTAVAPLGTAITENQLALLWRDCDEPVLCLDGDSAGIAAAHRAVDRALPLLKPGKSLSFVFLPDGQDPDDLVRAGGPSAFRAALGRASPLADVIWRREIEARPLDTPERRAAFRSRLRELVAGISDKDVRGAYGSEFARRLDEAFARPEPVRQKARWDKRRSFDAKPDPRISPALKRLGLRSAWAREATLLAAAIQHPALVERREADFHALAFESRDLDLLLRAVMAALAEEPGLDSLALRGHLQRSTAVKILERVLSDETLNQQAFLRSGAGLDEVEKGWTDALRLLNAGEARRTVMETASQSYSDGESVWKAAVQASQALANAKPEAESADGSDIAPAVLAERLERMKASVKLKRRR